MLHINYPVSFVTKTRYTSFHLHTCSYTADISGFVDEFKACGSIARGLTCQATILICSARLLVLLKGRGVKHNTGINIK